MSRTATFQIDTSKLMHEINVRNLSLSQVDRDTGRCITYTSRALRRGKMAVTQAILLERMYGIKRDDYELVEPEPVVVVEPPKDTDKPCVLDYDKLYNTIYAAVYAALRMNADEMKDRLFKIDV